MNTVQWHCPHCGACNLDDALTLIPFCGECQVDVPWAKVKLATFDLILDYFECIEEAYIARMTGMEEGLQHRMAIASAQWIAEQLGFEPQVNPNLAWAQGLRLQTYARLVDMADLDTEDIPW